MCMHVNIVILKHRSMQSCAGLQTLACLLFFTLRYSSLYKINDISIIDSNIMLNRVTASI